MSQRHESRRDLALSLGTFHGLLNSIFLTEQLSMVVVLPLEGE